MAREVFRAGTFTLMVGTAGLFLAAVSGLLDRSSTTAPGSRARRAVNVHATVVAPLMPLSVGNFVLRLGHYGGSAHTPAVVLTLTLVSLGVALVGGTLGGKLAYELGLGVAGTARPPTSSRAHQTVIPDGRR